VLLISDRILDCSPAFRMDPAYPPDGENLLPVLTGGTPRRAAHRP